MVLTQPANGSSSLLRPTNTTLVQTSSNIPIAYKIKLNSPACFQLLCPSLTATVSFPSPSTPLFFRFFAAQYLLHLNQTACQKSNPLEPSESEEASCGVFIKYLSHASFRESFLITSLESRSPRNSHNTLFICGTCLTSLLYIYMYDLSVTRFWATGVIVLFPP